LGVFNFKDLGVFEGDLKVLPKCLFP